MSRVAIAIAEETMCVVAIMLTVVDTLIEEGTLIVVGIRVPEEIKGGVSASKRP